MAVHFLFVAVCIPAKVGDIVCFPITTGAFDNYISCGQKRPIASPYFVQWCLTICFFILQLLLVLLVRLFNPKFRLRSSLKHRTRVLMGFLTFIGLFLTLSASPPDRTPPLLQALLSVSLIPITLIIRRIALRKTVASSKIICMFAVMIGLAISLEPTIFSFVSKQGSSVHAEKSHSGSHHHHAIWAMVLLLSFVPLSGMNVFSERVLQETDKNRQPLINPFVMIIWVFGWNVVFTTLAVFTELIPGLGRASGFHQLGAQLETGLNCMAGSGPPLVNCSHYHPLHETTAVTWDPDPHCTVPISRFWLAVVLFASDSTFNFLLIKYCDGAIYVAMVGSLKGPLAAIFWMLFRLDERSHFSWKPRFDMASYYVLAGLCIMAPATFIYNWLSLKEEGSSHREETGRSASGREDGRDRTGSMQWNLVG